MTRKTSEIRAYVTANQLASTPFDIVAEDDAG
jgi:hypothetical protein